MPDKSSSIMPDKLTSIDCLNKCFALFYKLKPSILVPFDSNKFIADDIVYAVPGDLRTILDCKFALQKLIIAAAESSPQDLQSLHAVKQAIVLINECFSLVDGAIMANYTYLEMKQSLHNRQAGQTIEHFAMEMKATAEERTEAIKNLKSAIRKAEEFINTDDMQRHIDYLENSIRQANRDKPRFTPP